MTTKTTLKYLEKELEKVDGLKMKILSSGKKHRIRFYKEAHRVEDSLTQAYKHLSQFSKISHLV